MDGWLHVQLRNITANTDGHLTTVVAQQKRITFEIRARSALRSSVDEFSNATGKIRHTDMTAYWSAPVEQCTTTRHRPLQRYTTVTSSIRNHFHSQRSKRTHASSVQSTTINPTRARTHERTYATVAVPQEVETAAMYRNVDTEAKGQTQMKTSKCFSEMDRAMKDRPPCAYFEDRPMMTWAVAKLVRSYSDVTFVHRHVRSGGEGIRTQGSHSFFSTEWSSRDRFWDRT